MSARLRRAWQARGPLALALAPLALLYGALVRLRRALYALGVLQSGRLPVPVIVVGNVTAGGAGKTPVVLALVRHLQARGWRPGIMSGRALLAAHPGTDIVVCDDGLQHLALQRQLEICVFNDQGAGNGWLLPAGPLREPWPRPVDLVLHAGPAPGGAAPQFAMQRALAACAIDAHGQRTTLADLRGLALHAVAAIARPEDFFAMLRARGLAPAHCEALPDHYDFDSWKPPVDAGERLICTEKDAVKLWPRFPQALAVPLELALEPAFYEALDARLASLSSPLA